MWRGALRGHVTYTGEAKRDTKCGVESSLGGGCRLGPIPITDVVDINGNECKSYRLPCVHRCVTHGDARIYARCIIPATNDQSAW